jgi:simple sugar transport system substrate-binding protein
VVGGKPDDPFWSIVKRGAEDAGIVAKAQGGSVTWLAPQNYDNLGPDAAELIRQAIAKHADAIVAPDWVPAAQDPAFKAVHDAGIPFIVAGGIQAADRLGALNYVGAVDYKAGVAGGEYVGKHGSKKRRLRQLPAGRRQHRRLLPRLQGRHRLGRRQGRRSAAAGHRRGQCDRRHAGRARLLLQHPDVDLVFTTANLDAVGAAQAVAQAGKAGKVQICGVNFDEAILSQISGGTQTCAVDQQGYQQGFYAVSILNGHVNYGLTIPTREILTGPGVVDASNIKATLAGAN